MKNESLSYTIYLSRPVQGHAIADAAKIIAEQNACKALCESMTCGAFDFLQIGQSMAVSHREIRIEAPYAYGSGWSSLIGLTEDYTCLRVIDWGFPGDKRSLVRGDDDFRPAVESFRDKLNAALEFRS